MSTQRSIAKIAAKHNIGEQKTDFAYWQTQSVESRLSALETIRREYHAWKDDNQSRFQRVLSITKRK